MEFAAIILAAGLSSRMGVLKPLLPVGERCAVLRCAASARSAGIHHVLIVTGNRREEVEDAVASREPDVRFVYNERYMEGMFSSVTAGIHALPDSVSGFFLLPADCCAVSPDTFLSLINTSYNGTRVIYPAYGGQRGHPPLIPAKLTRGIGEYSGKDGMRGFLAALPSSVMESNDPGILLDMDTPEDYSKLLKYLGLPTYPKDAFALLEKYNTPHGVIEHGRQVAALALNIAKFYARTGEMLDTVLLESACLLHDIKRGEPNHAEAGMKLLLREGYPAAAILVGAHMDGPAAHSAIIAESELLFLADKLCRRGKFVTIDESLRALPERFYGNSEAQKHASERLKRADAIMDILSKRYGIGYEDIFAV